MIKIIGKKKTGFAYLLLGWCRSVNQQHCNKYAQVHFVNSPNILSHPNSFQYVGFLLAECRKILHDDSEIHKIKKLGSVYCTVPVSDIKSLVHRIAFFALIRFKYSTLTHRIQSPDGVVVSTLDSNAEGWDIDSRKTHFLNIALESYFASNSFFLL